MLRILIVDDSIIMRNALKKIIKALGHQVVGEASSGYQAIEKYKKLVPDFTTMDITMPMEQGILNGVEAMKKIIELNKFAKIAMVTSHGEEELVMDAIKSGAKGYILKPITEEKIVELLSKIFPDDWIN
ncbi:MAG: response regulator [Arcobacteraceae bacterium]|nr:response regulator [Arcobacteraceae bacterium]